MSATMTLPVHSITPSIHQSYSSQSLCQISTQSATISKPSFIEYGNYRFVIVDAPTDSTIDQYLTCFKKKHVVAVARCCEPTYSIEPLTAANLKVIDIPYPDGDAPPRDVIDQFLCLVYEVFGPPVKSARKSSFDKDSARKNEDSPTGSESTKPAIAIHCVAGLGRAPCLVAIALMEHGIGAHAAIDLVRKKRRGAINAKQLAFLERYTPAPRGEACCTIM